MDEKEIRKILKEETVIPDNIDKAMEDVLKGILDSPDERIGNTNNLVIKPDERRKKSSGNKKKIIRILLPVAAVLGVSAGVLATKLGWLHKELEQQGVTGQETAQMIVTEPATVFFLLVTYSVCVVAFVFSLTSIRFSIGKFKFEPLA